MARLCAFPGFPAPFFACALKLVFCLRIISYIVLSFFPISASYILLSFGDSCFCACTTIVFSTRLYRGMRRMP